MSQVIASPAVVFTGTAAPLAAAVADAKKHVSGLDKSVLAGQERWATDYKRQAGEMRRTLLGGLTAGVSGAAASALGDLAGGGLRELGVGSVKAAADIETLTDTFTTLTGSAEKARGVLDEVRAFAAESPLGFADSALMAKQLMTAKVRGDQLIPTLRALADVAAGTAGGEGIGAGAKNLVDTYSKMKTDGRVYADQLNRMTGQGVPVIEALSVATGKNEVAIRDLVQRGEVGFPQMTAALKVMTEKGGTFFGRSEKYALSTAGAFDKLGDAYETLKVELGKTLIEELDLKGAAKELDNFVGRLKSGVGELRPAVHFAGEVLRASAQITAELGKGAVQFGTQLVDGLAASVPGLKEAAQSVRKVVQDAIDFRIDPVAVGEGVKWIGTSIASVLGVASDFFGEVGKDAKKFTDPILGAAREIRDLLVDVNRLKGMSAGEVAGAVAKDFTVGAADRIAGRVIGVRPSDTEYIKRFGGGDAGQATEDAFANMPGFGFGPAAFNTAGFLAKFGPGGPAAPGAPPKFEEQFLPKPPPVAPESVVEKSLRDRLADAFAASVDRGVAELVKNRAEVRDKQRLSDFAGGSPLNTLGPLSLGLGAGSPYAALTQAALGVKGLRVEAGLLDAKVVSLAESLRHEFGAFSAPVGTLKEQIDSIEQAYRGKLIDRDVRNAGITRAFDQSVKGLPEFKAAPAADYGSLEAAKLVQEAMGGRSESAEAALRDLVSIQRDAKAKAELDAQGIIDALGKLTAETNLFRAALGRPVSLPSR